MNHVGDREVTSDEDITFAKKPTFDDYKEKIKLGLGSELTNRLGLWRYGNIILGELWKLFCWIKRNIKITI